VRAALLASLLTLLAAGSAAAQPNPGVNGEIAFERGGVVQAFDPRAGTTRELARGAEPAWSPQGGLAYVRDAAIYLAGGDGAGEHSLTSGAWPAWSPDGLRLAFVRGGQLFALELATGTESPLTGAGDIVAPAWAPDGTRIAYGANGALFTVGLDGGLSTAVDAGVAASGGPAWSPDGTQLAFVGANGQLYVTAPDGSGTKQLTFTLMGASGVLQRPAWSPDGTLIAWAQGPDICVADPTGKVARLTRTPETAQPVAAAAPDWQSTSWPAYRPVAAAAGTRDAKSCDRLAGARVDILPGNVSPQIVKVAAPAELVFVNHLEKAVTVTVAGARATVIPGGTYGVPTRPGQYEYTVAGYPDGVPRRGFYVGTTAARATIEPHASITFGTSTMLTGSAAGASGDPVVVTATSYGSARSVRVATVRPTAGRWRLPVAPRVTTLYHVAYGGIAAERRLRVMPALRVSRSAASVRAAFTPAAGVRGRHVFLFRLAGRGWQEAGETRIDGTGHAAFASVAPGRYYVGFPGDAAYWSTASEPFAIGR
jgi:WD40-like Beta Propeller Repeat